MLFPRQFWKKVPTADMIGKFPSGKSAQIDDLSDVHQLGLPELLQNLNKEELEEMLEKLYRKLGESERHLMKQIVMEDVKPQKRKKKKKETQN